MSDANQRLDWLDAARGVGILLVVLGHTFTQPKDAAFRDTIYIFHMPLFFILSGYMSNLGSLPNYATRRSIQLLIPYLSYLFVIGLPVAIFTDHPSGRSPLIEFLTYFYGGWHLATWMTAFWFVTCLLFAQIAYRSMLNCRKHPLDPWLIFMVFGMYILAYVFSFVINIPTPLALGVAPMAIVFLWIGHIFRYFEKYSVTLVILSTINIIVMLIFYKTIPFFAVDLKYAHYGPAIFALLTAASFSILAIEISKRLDSIKYVGSIARWLGNSTISIMFLSQPIILELQHLQVSDCLVAVAAVIIPSCVHQFIFQFQPLSLLFTGRMDGISAIKSKLGLMVR